MSRLVDSQILTLQIGTYSNFIGTHYWNIQNENYNYSLKNKLPFEIDPSVLFRNTTSSSGEESYTPRLLIFDYNTNLGSISREGVIYNYHQSQLKQQQLDNSNGSGDDQQQVSKYISKPLGNPIIRNDQTQNYRACNFEYWSDYLQNDLNQWSIIDVNRNMASTATNNTSSNSGTLFDDGVQMGEDYTLSDRYQDNLRRYIEECDRLQGFQSFVDSDGIWGGLASSIYQYIADEYGSRPIVTFASTSHNQLIQSGNEYEIDERIYNISKTISHLTSTSNSIYIPLTSQKWNEITNIKFNQLNMNNQYQTSSILASSIDTSTLFYRANFDLGISDFVNQLSIQSRNLAILSSSFPNNMDGFGIKEISANNQTNNPFQFPKESIYSHSFMNYLSPRILNKSNTPDSEIISIRGQDLIQSQNNNNPPPVIGGKGSYDKVKNVLTQYLQAFPTHQPVIKRMICNINQPFELEYNSYFPLYKKSMEPSHKDPTVNISVDELPPSTILTVLQNGSIAHQYIEPLYNRFKSMMSERRIYRTDIEDPSNQSITESLINLCEKYK